MSIEDAIALIRPGIPRAATRWADLGAGTGLFTEALRTLLPGGAVYAVDKNPHALWYLEQGGPVELIITEADFNRPLELPQLDGILMANALHYASDPLTTLQNVLTCLRPGGRFLLIEYEQETPLPPWIPYPLPWERFTALAPRAGLSRPEELGRLPSAYGHRHLYAALSFKKEA